MHSLNTDVESSVVYFDLSGFDREIDVLCLFVIMVAFFFYFVIIMMARGQWIQHNEDELESISKINWWDYISKSPTSATTARPTRSPSELSIEFPNLFISCVSSFSHCMSVAVDPAHLPRFIRPWNPPEVPPLIQPMIQPRFQLLILPPSPPLGQQRLQLLFQRSGCRLLPTRITIIMTLLRKL